MTTPIWKNAPEKMNISGITYIMERCDWAIGLSPMSGMLREKDRRMEANCRTTIRTMAATKTATIAGWPHESRSVCESWTPKTVELTISVDTDSVSGPRWSVESPRYV